jgi:hypothetical protein
MYHEVNVSLRVTQHLHAFYNPRSESHPIPCQMSPYLPALPKPHLCPLQASPPKSFHPQRLSQRLCPPTMPPTLLSTISHMFLPPCLRSDAHIPPRQNPKKQIVCNQYQRRLYLRSIMPPTTRRQSRLAGSREVVPSGMRMDSQEAEDVTMRDVDDGVCGMVEESGVGVREAASLQSHARICISSPQSTNRIASINRIS